MSTPKKTTKAPKKPAEHPKYAEMIVKAITALKERGGSSRQAILKYIVANFKITADSAVVNSHLKMALRRGVQNKSLKQSKGTGASGSFKVGELPKPAKKKPAKKAVKPKAAKPKKSTPKKKPAAKKAAAKKPDGEKKTAKKPAAKKPATAKKPAAKKPAAKKPAAKKTVKSPKKAKTAKPAKKTKTPKK